MTKNSLTIIIINYFAFDELKDCLASIDEQYLEIRIFILDNATDGKSLEELKLVTNHEIHFLYSKENIGFTAGCNRTFNYVVQKFGLPENVLFLNPDIILSKNQLYELLETMKIHHADLVYPKTILPDGTPYCSGTHFDIRKILVYNHYYKDARKPLWADFYQGSVFIVKGSVYKSLGGMDDKLFMYFDEVDFSFRIKKAGFNILYNPMITIIHNASYSMKNNHYRKAYYIARNGLYIFHRYTSRRTLKNSFWFFYYRVFTVLILWYLKNGYIKSILYSLYGYYHAFRGRFGKLA